ncbi:GPI transamidase component PIG-T [Pterulicium gracile]|uniref:GPI transamidase component PIG-T n=1 Tax=Pterulicium gracile TaxID=1884261 RepID=A0A5C3QK17_9AGAR|nr:GPI transamidase component PIG-T [Pterula gracilis]
MKSLCFTALILSLITPAWTTTPTEQFYEELSFRNLKDGRVATRFSFKTVLNGSVPRDPSTLGQEDQSQHYRLFPLAMGQILREYALTELHLTLNAGNWDYDRWGYLDEPSVGTGAELWTWMADGAPSSIDERWEGTRNALGGLFCSSLGGLNDKRTTSPESVFRPEGDLPDWGKPHRLRHASLASENVCTENLTPFIKLLPCKALSGIATLLNPHRLFDADWHGLGVHVVWNEHTGVEISLVIQAVLNPFRFSQEKTIEWSFNSLFKKQVERQCPIASASTLSVSFPAGESWSLEPQGSKSEGGVSLYDLAQAQYPFDLQAKASTDLSTSVHEDFKPPLRVQRALNGPSQAYGRLSVSFSNTGAAPVQALYLETMPWLVQFYLHTLTASANGTENGELLSHIQYTPAVPHGKPATVQLEVHVPAYTEVLLTMEVAKSFLRYTDHPPDAQRGWDLPPAVVIPFLVEQNSSSNAISLRKLPRMYTNSLLVDLATPDFSMPYNVIIFTCSLIAFLFGSVFNMLTRNFVVVSLKDDSETEKP